MAKKIDATNILLENIINAIQDVKGKEIISLDLRKIDSAICKYFVICTGTSNTHVNSIESNIKKTISRDLGEKPFHIEGNNIGEWVLMDYSDIIVHVFQEKTRAFYNIEDFWGDAKFKNYKEEE
ncbi:MAG: ribosome silencing factor [Flavobacteriales bacterium]|jgi:ribosome-associated protein|nr:ribosome silencing factor [Flavobacteriales bacterium]MDG2264440.1 ribosome silencing factor [Flavobacteriales bacterium]|tara:strand:+ start:541 stop:912 length:372 start_codon:yes stop_codon:yes gene_type:complete